MRIAQLTGRADDPQTASWSHAPVPRALRGREGALRGLLAVGVCCSLVGSAGCDADLNRRRDTPPRIEGNQPQTAETPMPLAGPVSASQSARPSTDENMGRSFQGAIDVGVRTATGEQRRVRYMSRGNRARLQVDDVGGDEDLDALVWGESISIIDNEARSYRTFNLDDVKADDVEADDLADKKPAAPPTGDHGDEVRIEATGDRQMLNGVGCERYQISDGPLGITACVSPLPGTFAVDKLEAVSNLEVPAWVEHLLSRELLPLEAIARDASGRDVYTLELLRYSPGPVDESQVALPSTYRGIDPTAAGDQGSP